MTTFYETAQAYLEAGLSFFPTDQKLPAFNLLPRRFDPAEGKKKHTWIGYQHRQPYPEELAFWYKEQRAHELALVCGPSSNGNIPNAGLFIVDLDRPGLISAFRDACGKAWTKVAIQRTRKGGLHLAMLCDGAGEMTNKKLALRPNPNFVSREATPKETKYLCDIETRGMGGYACAWPTPNYSLEQFDFTHLPWVEMDDVVWPILQAAMSFNQVKDLSPSASAAREAHRDLPDTLSIAKTIIMEFRRRYSVSDMLLAYGYSAVGRCRFRRPGGRSGSVIVSDDNEIAVAFSSNDPLNQTLNALGKNFHDAFGIFAVIEHGGDVRSALASVAHDFGIAYHRPDYSDQRPDLHTASSDEVAFYAGEAGNDAIFMVDDQGSANILSKQGCAALYVPPGTADVGGWMQKCLAFPQRFAWLQPDKMDGATEMLTLAMDAKVLPCPYTAAELWERRGGNVEQFVVEVAQYIQQAQAPSLKVSARTRR